MTDKPTIISLSGPPWDPSQDVRQKSPAEGGCSGCGGWGYPVVGFIPEKRNGEWALRVMAPACPRCRGSGLEPAQHTESEMTAGREYNHKRITALLRHNAQKMALNWTLGNA